MKVNEILKRECIKAFHEACLDRGYTTDQIINKKELMETRNGIVKRLYLNGFTQKSIAALIGRSDRAVRNILKDIK